MRSRLVAVLGALVLAAFGACTRVEVTPAPGVSLGEGGAAGQVGIESGSPAGDGGAHGGGAPSAFGGAPGDIELGLWPTYATDPSEPRDVQAVFAAVSALSVGMRTLPLAERWDALSGATGTPLALTWNRLDAMVQPYRDQGASVALCIDVVDRQQPAWPFSSDLASSVARVAIERTVDAVYAHYGSDLSHLCFGYELDRYFASAGSQERASLLAFLKHAVAYAQNSPMRSSRTRVGTALTLGALTGASSVPPGQLLLGDEAVAVYDPLDAEGALKAPAEVADEVEAAVEALGDPTDSGSERLPLALLEVGYPSSTAIGSSEKAQLSFYQALLGALDLHRAEVSFVGVFGLGDRDASECEAEATAFGGSADAEAERALARCSMGLRAEPGSTESEVTADKLAWPAVLAAVSRYH